MATAAYTTDLTEAGKTLSNADATTNWAKTTAAGWTAGGATAANQTENYIQGSASCSITFKATGVGGLVYNNAAGATIPADGAYLCWGYYASMNGLQNKANGGIRLTIGNSLTVFNGWKLSGSDALPYGGWKNYAANPNVTPDYTVGAPTSTYQYFGFFVNSTASISKGEPYAVDCIRAGRCDARFAGGTSPDAACTFAGFAAVNDATSARWGLIQAIDGGYLWKGLMTLGYGAACRFTDANTQVLIDNTEKVTAAFNKIDISNASSEINWTSINFLALGTTSKGRLEVVDDCDVNISGCTFTGMDTFIFKSASDVLNSTFRNCGVITANSANFAGTQFEGYAGAADSSYLVWDTNIDPSSKLANCKFTKGSATAHAITFGTNSPTEIHIPNSCTFPGYNAANSQNDSTVYVARTTGAVTIYYDGTLSYKSAGATVTISASQIDVTITGLKDNTEVRVYAEGTSTELAGTENATAGTENNRTFTFTLAAATEVDIRIFALGYLPSDILGYTVPGANASIPVQQVYDRVYENIFVLTYAPTITEVSTDPGYAGQQVTITGTNFDIGEIEVYFDTSPATNVSVTNATTLTCILPEHDDGLVEVWVVNEDGISNVPHWFTYQAPSGGPSLVPIRKRSRLGALLQT